MNRIIDNQCKKDSAYSPRLKSDKLFSLEQGSFDYNGYFDKNAKLIQDEYLCNSKTWKMFVRQFKEEGDGKTLAWRGEYWGKMMRGAALTYKYTQNEKLYGILTETAEDMLDAQQESGRFSTYNVDVEFDGWDLWSRKYVLLGFQYYLEICKDENLAKRIIKAMCRHTDYIMQYVGREEDGKKLITKCSNAWLGLNSASILEPIVRLYNITGDKKYYEFAEYIVQTGGVTRGDIFEAAFEDKLLPYEYETNKAYEMMSCFEGLLEFYRVSGVEKYKEAAIRFGKRIIESDITIIGCSGCKHEEFDNSSKTQLNIEFSGVMQETCVTVTWMKFCYQLLCLTGDPVFADQIEKSAYNAISGAVNNYKIKDIISGFPFDSYSPLLYSTRARSNGGYQMMEEGPYGCCACIGSAGTALIPLSSAMLSKDGIYFNLYIPGEIKTETPTGKHVTINIDTEYPRDGKIKITVNGTDSENMVFAFRIPEFSSKFNIYVNGNPVKAEKCGYVKLEREWENGDIVEIDLDVRVRTYRCEGVNGSGEKHVALIKGPVVLARDARLGEKIDEVVQIAEDKDGFVDVKPSFTAKFETNLEYKVPLANGSYFTVIDYASAGKTWSLDSLMTAWMATEDYWSVDFTKPVKIASRNNYNKHSVYVGDDGTFRADAHFQKYDYWTLEDAEGGLYRIKSEDGRYVTVKGEGTDDIATLEDRFECDSQKWKIENIVQNRYYIISAKNGCNLYEKLGTEYYRLYAIKPGADNKYDFSDGNINLPVCALFEISN